jgi:hypothetical protein
MTAVYAWFISKFFYTMAPCNSIGERDPWELGVPWSMHIACTAS